MTDQTHDIHHVMPLRMYFIVFFCLMGGTATTVAASFVHLGPVNVPLMLFIAIVKATLVALFFMHLYYDEKFNLIVLLGGIAFVLIFFVFTLFDPLTRGTINQIERHPINWESKRSLGAIHADGATSGTQSSPGHDAPTTSTTEHP